MVISRPCLHPVTPAREGYVRGQYESVEFIREIPLRNFRKSMSTTNLHSEGHSRQRTGSTLGREAILRNAKKYENGEKPSENVETQSETTGRSRGKTISFDHSRGSEAKGEEMDVPREDESEDNPVEWIMITRSDPGGSVPRFMIERGTPGGIVGDASKFLNWACAKDMEDFDSDDEILAGDDKDEKAQNGHHRHHDDNKSLQNFQTNGHLAGIEEAETPTLEVLNGAIENGGLYGMVAGAATLAGGFIAAHTLAIISDHLPGQEAANGTTATSRRDSVSTLSSVSSVGSFASALEGYSETDNADASSTSPSARIAASQDKELQKLEERKRKLDGRLDKARSKKTEDRAKEEEAIRKAEERHSREVRKQEEKYKNEVEKLERKKEKEAQKAQARKRKAGEKDEKSRLMSELESVKAENGVLRKEKELLRIQVGELQAENTALAARVGRLGVAGEEVLRDVREGLAGRSGRLRASSLKGLARAESFRSGGSVESGKEKENVVLKT